MKKPKEQQDNPENFDEQLELLRSVVERLEHGGLTLDESLKLFEEGIALSRKCMETLNHSEGKVQELLATMEKIPFSKADE